MGCNLTLPFLSRNVSGAGLPLDLGEGRGGRGRKSALPSSRLSPGETRGPGGSQVGRVENSRFCFPRLLAPPRLQTWLPSRPTGPGCPDPAVSSLSLRACGDLSAPAPAPGCAANLQSPPAPSVDPPHLVPSPWPPERCRGSSPIAAAQSSEGPRRSGLRVPAWWLARPPADPGAWRHPCASPVGGVGAAAKWRPDTQLRGPQETAIGDRAPRRSPGARLQHGRKPLSLPREPRRALGARPGGLVPRPPQPSSGVRGGTGWRLRGCPEPGSRSQASPSSAGEAEWRWPAGRGWEPASA